MKLDEAITELEEHGYALNEWKITPDFAELKDEDKKLLTKAMNGMYTAKKSGNKKNIDKYTAVIKDIAGKLKHEGAKKKLARMVGSVATAAPTPAPAPKKEPEGTIHQRRTAFLNNIFKKNAEAEAAGRKDYGAEYRDTCWEYKKRISMAKTYDELVKIKDEFSQKTWLFKDIRCADLAEDCWKDLQSKISKLNPANNDDKLKSFAKMTQYFDDASVEKISDGLEITGRYFKNQFVFTIHNDLTYELSAGSTDAYGDDYDSDTSGKFKDTVLTRTPEELSGIIARKVLSLTNWED